MEEAIVDKLRAELAAGIASERQVVYSLVEIRKLLERDGRQSEFTNLLFYCDWATHAVMDRAGAKRFVRMMDAAAAAIIAGGTYTRQLAGILSFKSFRVELNLLFKMKSLSPLDGEPWRRFLTFYSQVIGDCPCRFEAGASGHSFEHCTAVELGAVIGNGVHTYNFQWMLNAGDRRRYVWDMPIAVGETRIEALESIFYAVGDPPMSWRVPVPNLEY